MEISGKIITVSLGLSLLIGVYIGQRYTPVGETKTVEVIKDKIITKTVKIKTPNGTETTETTKTEDKNTAKVKDILVAKSLPEWRIMIGSDTSQVQTLAVQKRIAGPFIVGASISNNNSAGVQIGFEF